MDSACGIAFLILLPVLLGGGMAIARELAKSRRSIERLSNEIQEMRPRHQGLASPARFPRTLDE